MPGTARQTGRKGGREVDKERERGEMGEGGERQAAGTACTSAINPVPDSFK